MHHASAVFENRLSADTAISDLAAAGFAHEDISLLVSEDAREKVFYKTEDEAHRAAVGGITGALTVGALGALLVGATVVAGIAAPGVGLLAAGPIVAMLATGGAGAAVGGIGGALIASGFAADEANRYEDEIKAGKAVVLVHAKDKDRADQARAILISDGATRAA